MQPEPTNSLRSRSRGLSTTQLMLVIGLLTLAGVIAGCSISAQPKAPAPVEVSVAEVICKQLGDSDEFTGRLEAVHAVEVRPRVSGYLQSVHFKEG
jgi:multidrug efflux pump subunit AcrA (membrane-fusion protein)